MEAITTKVLERSLVIGCGGSGKSTFARSLAAVTGNPLIHLDREYWRPGWVEPATDEWETAVASLIAAERWVMDGNYSRTLNQRLERATAVFFLDMPRHYCLRRVLLRTYQYRGESRPDMTEGCPEKVDLEFLGWIWNYPRRSRAKVRALLDDYRGTLVHFSRPAQVEDFLHRLAPAEALSAAAEGSSS